MNQSKTGEEFTRRAINKAYNIFKPSYICMVGICYGLYINRDTLGSVFISDSLTTFRLNFRDEINSDEVRFEAEDEYNQQPLDNIQMPIIF